MSISFSIIIPTYNAEQSIGQCLTSLSDQHYDSFEVIVVDGNSTDDTVKIASRYAKALQLEILSQPDLGIYDAMNKGIKLANGNYLLFLGADDYLLGADVLVDIEGLLNNLEADIIYGNVWLRDDKTSFIGQLTDRDLFYKNIPHQAIFYKRQVFKKIGDFDLRFKLFSDWHHNIKWFFHPDINHVYADVIVSSFGQDGISTHHHDIEFRKAAISHYYKNATRRNSSILVIWYIISGLFKKLLK